MRRVSSGTTVISRASAQKVEALRGMIEAQKRQLLEMRSARDQIAVLMRDVETAQRAYEAVSQRSSQLNLESQASQSILRILSPAVEPLEFTSRKVKIGVLGSLVGGLGLGLLLALGLEIWDRRVRGVEDVDGIEGIPLIATLGTATAGSGRRPNLPRPHAPGSPPALQLPGARG